jgi:hypothetical protein
MNRPFSAWSVLVLGLLMIAFLAGCGGVSANTPRPTPTPTPNPSPTPPGATPTPTPAAHGTFVYFSTSASTSNTLGYRLNPDGTLVPLAGSPFAVNGALAAAGNFLAVSSTSAVSTFLVDPASGALSLSGTANVIQAGAIAADARNVYVAGSIPANNSTGIYGFAISGNGTLTPLAGSPFVFSGACDLCDTPFVLDLNNNFVIQGGTGFHGVGDFTVYPRGAGGVLGMAHILGTDAIERVSIQRPAGNFAVGLDIDGGVLSEFSINPSGQPTETAAQGTAFGQDVLIDNSGKFLLMVDQQGLVHVFTINPATGTVTEVSRSDSAGPNAGPIAMDPSGRFVFVGSAAGTVSGSANQITVFAFNPATGAMTRQQAFPTPGAPGAMVFIAR